MLGNGKKWFLTLASVVVVSLIVTSCQCQPKVVTEEVVVTVETEGETVEKVVTVMPTADVPPEGPIAADGLVACKPLPDIAFNGGSGSAHLASMVSAPITVKTSSSPAKSVAAAPTLQEGTVYRVGVFADLTTLNYFAANGPDNTIWNAYMLPPRLTMYALADQRFDFVPLVAKDLPTPLEQEGDFWVVEIEIWDNITWSDGESFTAEDVAWTANAVIGLGLISGNWSQWYDANYLDHVEATGDYTVKYFYHTKPGLARHEYGTLGAPILAEHYWAPIIAEAMAPVDALGDDPSEEDLLTAQQEAHDTLFAHEPEGEPMAGTFLFSKWEKSAFMENTANLGWPRNGVKVTLYENGAYQETMAGVYDYTLYGEATGDVELEVTYGPFVESAVYTIYASQDAAVLALKNGEIDFLLNPLGLQQGLLDQVEGDENLTVLKNSVNGFRYMAFNHRRQPMNDCAFRQAVAILIDKEFVTQRVLQGVAFPLYSFVPEANGAWYSDDVPKLGLYEDGTSMSREDRINLAVSILEQGGYSWEDDVKPEWDADGGHVNPGGRLILPDGTPSPVLELWGPSSGYDPLRATFAQWIEGWLNEAGIPVEANLAGFNVLIPRIFTEHNFDMYILGWGLGVFPGYMRDFWHSEQAVPDGNNAAGYSNPEFDTKSEAMLTCETFEECKKISDELQIMLSTEVPYVLLFDTGIIEPYRSAAVEYPFTAHLSGLQAVHQGPFPSSQSAVKVK
jgi:ABC-type transport system substrate-binding protein